MTKKEREEKCMGKDVREKILLLASLTFPPSLLAGDEAKDFLPVNLFANEIKTLPSPVGIIFLARFFSLLRFDKRSI